MKRKLRHIGLLTWLLALTPLLSGCIYDHYKEEPAPGSRAILSLRLGVVGGTRADLGGHEDIKSVRIIIITESESSTNADGTNLPKGTLEHNVCYPIEGAADGKQYLFPVSEGTKRIYMIANAESVPYGNDGSNLNAWLDTQKSGSEISAALDNLSFTADYNEAGATIPLCAMYNDIVVNEKTNGSIHDMYLVRTATKFDVEIVNHREDFVRVKSFSVNGINKSGYLFPHFTENAGIYTYDSNGVATRRGFIFDAGYNGTNEITFTSAPIKWDEWLYKVCRESQTYPDPPTADKRGWIMEYNVPNQNDKREVEWNVNGFGVIDHVPNADATVENDGAKYEFPVTVYLPESKNIKDGGTPAGLEQEYTFKVKFETADTQDAAEWTASPEFPKTFNNLRALFRNTHVKLQIDLYHDKVEWTIYVRDWNFLRLDEIMM